MASSRDLRNKIRSVTNTKKITRTMELVATSKAKKAQDRVVATTPYSTRLGELLVSLSRAGTVEHPLLGAQGRVRRTALLVITANRGLCGGYNSSVLHLAERIRAAELTDGRDVDVYVVGRKAISRMKFLRISVVESFTRFDDRPTFKDASAIADLFMGRFLAGEIDRAVVVSTRYLSAGSQVARANALLPIEPPPAESQEPNDTGGSVEFLFEPDPASILDALLPLSVQTVMYRLLVEAVASEQISRRMAMKRATDNAEEMIENYTRLYNRSRQAGITQQINEIVSGASALE